MTQAQMTGKAQETTPLCDLYTDEELDEMIRAAVAKACRGLDVILADILQG